MRKWLWFVVVVGLSSTFLGGSAYAAPQIAWMTSWAEAQKEAKAQNRPIMIHYNMDDEPACADMARSHLRSKEIVELSKRFVCVVGSLGEHSQEDLFKAEGGKEVCHRFGSVTCDDHRRCEIDSRLDILESSLVTAPQYVFLTPDRKILSRRIYSFSANELAKMMRRALAYFDTSMSLDEETKRDRQALVELLAEAKSDNAMKRKSAVDALAKRDDPEVVAFFIAQTATDVDEVKRREAVRALGTSATGICLPRLLVLTRDRSSIIRREAAIALYYLAVGESMKSLLEAFGVEQSLDTKRLFLRTLAVCAGSESKVQDLLLKQLSAQKEELRSEAAYSLGLTFPPPATFQKICSLAKGDGNQKVRAVALYAAVQIGRRYIKPSMRRDLERVSAAHREAVEKYLRPLIAAIAQTDSEKAMRDLAERGLQALEKQGSDMRSYLEVFFDPEILFKTE